MIKYDVTILEDETVEWRQDGKLHRHNGPAIERPNGEKEYYQKGLLHRDNGPVIQRENGYTEYRQHGELHRLEGPAKIHASGSVEYYCRGNLHCLCGPAVVLVAEDVKRGFKRAAKREVISLWEGYAPWTHLPPEGSLPLAGYYIHGVQMPEHEYWTDESVIHCSMRSTTRVTIIPDTLSPEAIREDIRKRISSTECK